MSEKFREVSQLADATYADTVVIETTMSIHCILYFLPLWFSLTLPIKVNAGYGIKFYR